MRIVEPKPERVRDRELRESPGPRELLTRWAAILWALAKLLLGGILVWGACIFLLGALTQYGILPESDGLIFVWLIGMVLVARLYGAWVLPVRY